MRCFGMAVPAGSASAAFSDMKGPSSHDCASFDGGGDDIFCSDIRFQSPTRYPVIAWLPNLCPRSAARFVGYGNQGSSFVLCTPSGGRSATDRELPSRPSEGVIGGLGTSGGTAGSPACPQFLPLLPFPARRIARADEKYRGRGRGMGPPGTG